MSNELTWPERVNMLSINPDAATRDDVARMASELSTYEMFMLRLKASVVLFENDIVPVNERTERRQP